MKNTNDSNQNWQLVENDVGLLHQSDSRYGPPGADGLEKQIKRDLTADERTLLSRNASGKWKTFSDDLISFDLPDDPLLKVDVLMPEEEPRLQIVGGAVGSTDKSFQRVYRITFAEEIPYGLILVTDEKWFDDGICFCGPIALKTFSTLQGNLIEMSQLPSGDVKKFQTINDAHRAILFEWTHSAITQSAYFRIGASLRLKPASTRNSEEWYTFSKKHRGFISGFGWLRPNMKTEDIILLLGEPTQQSESQLQYIKDEIGVDINGRGWRNTYTIPISDGRLVSLGSNWTSSEELAAERGSHAWIEDTLRNWNDKSYDLPEGKHPELPPEDVKLILDIFDKEAASSDGKKWEFWSGVIADLTRLGIRNEKAAKLIISRAGEKDLLHFQTRWIMELYDFSGLEEFEHERLSFLMGHSETAVKYRKECINLFPGLEAQDHASSKFIHQGLSHKSVKVRRPAVFALSKLPAEEALKAVRIALSDLDENVRWYAILNVSDVCTKNDLEWLEEILIAETNERNKKELKERIIGLQ